MFSKYIKGDVEVVKKFKAMMTDEGDLSFVISNVKEVNRFPEDLDMGFDDEEVRNVSGIKGFRGTDKEFFDYLGSVVVKQEDWITFSAFNSNDETKVVYFETSTPIEELEGIRFAGC